MAAGPTMLFEPLGSEADFDKVSSVCIGTGRFLRGMLVPALVELGGELILTQTRGNSFPQYMASRLPERTFEVDTVLQDGQVLTSYLPVAACGTLGNSDSRAAFMKLPARLPQLRYIGLGLTEAGIEHNGRSILDLAEFLYACFEVDCKERHMLSILNTDNVPFNGDAVSRHVCSCDFTQNAPRSQEFEAWLQKRVCFHNTMVDRITSAREGCPDVPRAEPLPAKALVIEDLQSVLPLQFGSVPGVAVRTKPGHLAQDIALKLRIANGIHTAMVYAMALEGLFKTDDCIGHNHVLPYLEQLFERDIVNCCQELKLPRLSVTPVFSEWMSRLQHKYFGLECFFVCQNATQKMGIRLLPSVCATLAAEEVPSDFMMFSLAVILRFLTPVGEQQRLGESPPVFTGRLDITGAETQDFNYVPGLLVRPSAGTYEFKDGDGIVPLLLRPLGRPGGCSATACTSIAGEVLSRLEGFDCRGVPEHAQVAERVGNMLRRLLSGEKALDLLAALNPKKPLLLQEKHLEEAVKQEVEAAEAVDVHTHLFSASHGESLMEYGIDAMLTYHYLVSEYLANSCIAPQDFYALPRGKQAEHVWEGLFVNASPLSEPCRGVLTTLGALGLREEVAARDLAAIRRWYAGQDAEMFNEKMMRLARLRFVVTSQDPFQQEQLDACLRPPESPPRYRNSLALDKLLEGDWPAVRKTLEKAGKPLTLSGVKALVLDCVNALKPIFLTAATPENWNYSESAEARKVPDNLWTQDLSSLEPTPEQVLEGVVLPICSECCLPLSLRMGVRRSVVPALKLAGDTLGPAGLKALGNLCEANPKLKFLFSVLSRNDQHEAAVLASKFRNLHIWGCWWYCNYPSVVSEVAALRLEMLGTGFTYQASSARVHDQLIYKWIHSRAMLSKLLISKYVDLMATGWQVSRGDIRRDVQRLLGGSFEEFLAKKL